jgi:preprotein translocase subunit SecD
MAPFEPFTLNTLLMISCLFMGAYGDSARLILVRESHNEVFMYNVECNGDDCLFRDDSDRNNLLFEIRRGADLYSLEAFGRRDDLPMNEIDIPALKADGEETSEVRRVSVRFTKKGNTLSVVPDEGDAWVVIRMHPADRRLKIGEASETRVDRDLDHGFSLQIRAVLESCRKGEFDDPVRLSDEILATEKDIVAAFVEKERYHSYRLVLIFRSAESMKPRALAGAKVGQELAIVANDAILLRPIVEQRIDGNTAAIVGIPSECEANRMANEINRAIGARLAKGAPSETN